MLRKVFIERVRRQIYGGQPSNDASITVGLVNNYLDDAIAYAAKTNYVDSLKIEGIAYVNNSFYTTYKALSVVPDEQFLWKITLPQIPIGIGENSGAELMVFKDAASNELSMPVIWVTQKQRGFAGGMREIPNKILAYMEGSYIYAKSTVGLNAYTAQVTMVSGGDGTDLNSTINVPQDYFPLMMEYLQKQLLFERNQPVDNYNDGVDAIKTV